MEMEVWGRSILDFRSGESFKQWERGVRIGIEWRWSVDGLLGFGNGFIMKDPGRYIF